MSGTMNEPLFGRLHLLVLSACPVRLRRVIDHLYTKEGYSSFENFLESKKHLLFHKRFKNCCCGHKSQITFLKGQWHLLYKRIAAQCPDGSDIPCHHQYEVRRGITTDDLCIILCCFLLANAFQCIPESEVYKIRDVRNKMVHSNSDSKDFPSFNEMWVTVAHALLKLSDCVSVDFRKETKEILQDLESISLDPSELDALLQIIKDHRNIDNLKKV